MLELKNIVKEYYTTDETVRALKGVSLRFRKSEFVSILGPSGCGKTTLLNIIGGLDRYTSGDLIINGKSTKNFTDKDWDTYRNHSVGFVFQSYNLIPHQTVLENVELALTLSGINAEERKERAIKVLTQVGLENKINSRPNQLSGGQMQRVAIARALINDPEILLADEPTGALDSKTSVQIMELLKEISSDRLIIMVTHNPDIAEQYSSRIIRLLDGELVSDGNPVSDAEIEQARRHPTNYERTNKGRDKTSMSFGTALSLSFRNLMTKKARTFLVSFAGSIGIIGIALILSLSSGFKNYIDKVQEDTLSSYPVSITKNATDMSAFLEDMSSADQLEEFPDSTQIGVNESFTKLMEAMSSATITNDLKSLKKYLSTYDESKITAIKYTYNLTFSAYGRDEIYDKDNVILESAMDKYMALLGDSTQTSSGMGGLSMGSLSAGAWAEVIDNETLIKSQYDLIGNGKWADFSSPNEIMLAVNKYNMIPDYVLSALGLMDPNEVLYPLIKSMMETAGYSKDVVSVFLEANDIRPVDEEHKSNRNIDINDIIGKEFFIMIKGNYYKDNGDGTFSYQEDGSDFVNNAVSHAMKVKIVGAIRPKEDAVAGSVSGNLIYSSAFTRELLRLTSISPVIVAQQENPTVDVTTGSKFGEDIAKKKTLDSNLTLLGYADVDDPVSISLYASTFENKDYIVQLIEDYNAQNPDNEIVYTDYLGIMMSSITTIINAITYVLIGFVSVSLVVSSIMIGIITYISVLERIKEIGILRALGASKKDVSRVFNAETFIIGLTSGVIGIGVTILLDIPISLIIKLLANITNIARLPIGGAIVLILISCFLTFIAGLIPSRIASKKDPVIALRSE